jgi:hypothetical protein
MVGKENKNAILTVTERKKTEFLLMKSYPKAKTKKLWLKNCIFCFYFTKAMSFQSLRTMEPNLRAPMDSSKIRH